MFSVEVIILMNQENLEESLYPEGLIVATGFFFRLLLNGRLNYKGGGEVGGGGGYNQDITVFSNSLSPLLPVFFCPFLFPPYLLPPLSVQPLHPFTRLPNILGHFPSFLKRSFLISFSYVDAY